MPADSMENRTESEYGPVAFHSESNIMPENPILNRGTRAIGCLWFPIWCGLAGVSPAQTTLIDATFDGVSNDTNPNFQIISNTLADGSGASWNQSTGYVNRGTATNSTAGAVSVTALDIAALGSDSLVLTAEVQGQIPTSMYMYPAVKNVALPPEWVTFAPLSPNPITVPASA